MIDESIQVIQVSTLARGSTYIGIKVDSHEGSKG